MSVSNIERIYNLKVGDRIRNKTTGGTNSGKFGVITAIHPGLTLADPYVVQYDDGKTGQGSDEHYEKIVEEDKFGPESYRIKFNPDD